MIATPTLHRSRWLLAVSAIVLSSTLAPAATVSFYGVGQLPSGGINSQIRDAVITSTGILAVGNAQANASSTLADTAVLWTPTEGLQTLDTLNNVAVPLGRRFMTASQIASGNHVIASRIFIDGGGRDIYPALYNPGGPLTAVEGLPSGLLFGAANGISSNGQITYGFGIDASGNYQAFRWNIAEGAVPLPAIAGYTNMIAAFKGSSENGSIDVGAASAPGNPQYAPGSIAYLYDASAGISQLPFGPGGTWAGATGIDPSGTYVIGCGDTPANPKGELLLWTGGTVTAYGVPAAEAANGINTNVAGVTRNGQVVIVAGMVGSYLHNAYGWFDLQTVLTAGGADLTGWTVLDALGVNGAGTLVFGSGTHNGGPEGFVAQVSAGFLENYGKPKKTKG
jgi:hypothetical protein